MRIPTYTQYSAHISMLNKQTEQLSRIQAQMSNQKKLLSSSDDPVLSNIIKSTQTHMDTVQSYSTNLIAASRRSSLVETSLKMGIGSLQRVTELFRAAQSDVASNTDREKMATEIADILNAMLDTANSRDANGDYLFSGINTNQLPFSKVNGTYQYFGSLESSSLYTSDGTSVVYNDSGYDVFGNAKQGNGYFTIRQGTPPNTGTAETSVGAISSLASYVEDSYTLTFSMNGGNLEYQVVGASSGTVVAATPYVQGEVISFNGVNFKIQGVPDAGDTFVIEPSTRQNVFETLRQMVDLLNTPITNDAERAAFHQKIGELGASVGGASNEITNYLSKIGYRMRELEAQQSRNDDQYDGLVQSKGRYEDIDIYELSAQYEASKLSLQITQQTYIQLQSFFSQLLLLSSSG